jgi:hypothetical protein
MTQAKDNAKDAAAKAAAAKANKDSNPSNSGDAGSDPGAGVVDAITRANDARTKVETKGLAKGEVVDARLDNRVGEDRPRRESFPAVPQQVDGPDLAHQAEFTKAYLDAVGSETVKAGSRKGMHSPGPHGLGSEDERVSGDGDTGDVDAMKEALSKGYDSRRY